MQNPEPHLWKKIPIQGNMENASTIRYSEIDDLIAFDAG